MTKSVVFLAGALIASTAHANAIECQAKKGAGYPWSWRQIDGQKCWYKGMPGMDKDQLRWAATKATASATPSAAPPAKRKRASSAMVEDTVERERLLQSYWPPLPPNDVFGDRFEAVRAGRQY